MTEPLRETPLAAVHRARGAKMVPFAGYAMPVQYPTGILAEHRQARSAAALFDVSHMGQLRLVGDDAAAALETLVPMDICGLAPGRQRYAFFTDPAGGILDDLMVTKRAAEDGGDLLLVVNAGTKEADVAHLRQAIGNRCSIEPMFDRALLALQGPEAGAVVAALAPELAGLVFMDGRGGRIGGVEVFATRSGYTGEDGFEIGCAAADAEALATALLADPRVAPAGLGARDTLRLEAGLCLHGHDIDATTTPIEAGLTWALQKVRRPGGAREGGYPGAERIGRELAEGAARQRVGLVGSERVPVREGAVVVDPSGATVGRVTSGTISPNLGVPIAMAYVEPRPRCRRHRPLLHRPRQGAADDRRRHALRAAPLPPRLNSTLNEDPSMTLRYTSDHEWLDATDASRATVGITQHAQDALGDVVFVDLPAVGKRFAKGEVAGVVESVKAAADLFMPVAGTVVEVNEALRADPSLANSDPEAAGWFSRWRSTMPRRSRR
jgi:aminomethyltransferase